MKKKELRYEKKIVLKNIYYDQFLNLINNIRIEFRKSYPKRIINNIYFDDLDFNSFLENLDGLADRKKIRVRWYGDCFGLINSNLEFKCKKGNVGYKEIYRNLNFEINNRIKLKELNKKIINKIENDYLKLKLISYQPTLFNRYEREYYESLERNIRITIDKNIYSKKVFPNSKISYKAKDRSDIVIAELKFDNLLDINLVNKLLDFKFSISKHSKYVYGLTNTYL
jgi:SPX domain protein involved in polyphosphate accumulation